MYKTGIAKEMRFKEIKRCVFNFNAFFAPILHRLIIPDCLAFMFQAQRGGLGQVTAARLQVAEEEIPPVDTSAKRRPPQKQAQNKRKTRTQK
eukprot:COSAG06_NODE_7648_length_2428_cov_18.499785_3_plen_92_part_00